MIPCYHHALQRATDAIAPVWPLDQWIAVNPWWGLKGLPIEQVSEILTQRAGQALTMPADFYRAAWKSGRITPQDLQQAIRISGVANNEQALLGCLSSPPKMLAPYDSAWDMLGADQHAFDPVAEFCASYFDQHQQRWENSAGGSLYTAWQASARHDRRLPKQQRQWLQALPEETNAVIDYLAVDLALSPHAFEVLVHTLLLRVNGWASWCQGVAWHSASIHQQAVIQQLAAVVLAWEWLAARQLEPAKHSAWKSQWSAQAAVTSSQSEALWCWQRAYELGYQRSLANTLLASGNPEGKSVQVVRAAFCIDVRSERFRRHLEQVAPTVGTLGVAGFFGMLIADSSVGPERSQPRVPGLLKPRYRMESPKLPHPGPVRYQQESERQSVRHAKYAPLSMFTLVETTGIAWGWKLLKDSLRKQVSAPHCEAPAGLYHSYDGDPISSQEKVTLAKSLMTSLGVSLAPLLVLVGHDSQSDNNPHHAGLACGACGGQGGGVNARVAAELLNDPEVRQGLQAAGFALPCPFFVLAATHCTLTDRVTVYRDLQMPDALKATLQQFERELHAAGQATRQERAVALGVNETSDEARLSALAARGADWSQPRPEWGLVNNAALLLAPRSVSQGKALDGRVFLHEYDAEKDQDGSALEALMMAPMLVASWINLQYYASTVAPTLYGAGNKLLHSVVGGHLGVIEGNSPQLRIGLPEQSLYDGKTLHHEPLRLTVVIEAPRGRIEAIVSRQQVVADLVNNRWLWLCRRIDEGLEVYAPEGWQRVEA
jgi:uncharacterized protein YbcC (UPF0753/DUF2309 family)